MIARSLLDPLRGLRHSMGAVLEDLGTFARYSLARRIKMMRGDLDGAMRDSAILLRQVRFARESMFAYAHVDRMIRAQGRALSVHCPDEQYPDRFLLFVGQSRSGHSLVGSLIDAHPNAVVAHEIFALKHLLQGRPFDEVLRAIKYNAYFFDYLGRAYTGYDYEVPGQYQGRYRQLQIVGDKKGNATTRLLGRRPDALDRLESALCLPVVFVHVIRDPYDNIATKARRTGVTLDEAARRYFANAETVSKLKGRAGDRLFDIYLDDLIERPEATLRSLMHWLDLPIDRDFLAACAAIVFKEPSRTARSAAWDPRLLAAINRRLERYPFLHRFLGERPS